jgi:hypothetical protein
MNDAIVRKVRVTLTIDEVLVNHHEVSSEAGFHPYLAGHIAAGVMAEWAPTVAEQVREWAVQQEVARRPRP